MGHVGRSLKHVRMPRSDHSLYFQYSSPVKKAVIGTQLPPVQWTV